MDRCPERPMRSDRLDEFEIAAAQPRRPHDQADAWELFVKAKDPSRSPKRGLPGIAAVIGRTRSSDARQKSGG